MNKTKRNLMSEDLKRIKVNNDPQFSPDGKDYIFTSTLISDADEYQSHLYYQKLEEESPTQWTFGNVRDTHPRFSPNGKQIVFLSNRSGISQLWLIPTTGGEARQLTHFKHGAGSAVWSPNGDYLLFTASIVNGEDVNESTEMTKEERKKEEEEKAKQVVVVDRLKYKSDGAGFHDETRKQLVLYDVNKEAFIQLTSANRDHSGAAWSPDNKTISFIANSRSHEDHKLNQDIYLMDIFERQAEKLTNSNGSYSSLSWSGDGTMLACFGHQFDYDGASLARLWILDVNKKKEYCLTEQWDVQIGDALIGDTNTAQANPGPVWLAIGNELLVTASENGHTGLYKIDLDGNRTTVYQKSNHLYGFSYSASTDQIIAGISDPDKPGEIYLLQDGERNQLTNLNQSLLDQVELSIPELVEVSAEDGWNIQGWLLRPVGYEEGEKYPLILEIHGGPHAMYGHTFFHELQLLAAQGYAVLYTNPRGSHGYGQAFVNACRGDYGGKDYTDLMSALDYVVDKYNFIDETRLGVTGGSYGGFMTNWIVSHTNRFKAAVTQRSISNWLSFYGVSDIGFFFTKWEIGHNLLDNPEKLWKHSPLKYVENIETPLLILHGEKDFRCPIEQAEQLFITMKHLGKEVQFVRFPGATHELSRSGTPSLRVERLNQIINWFHNYL